MEAIFYQAVQIHPEGVEFFGPRRDHAFQAAAAAFELPKLLGVVNAYSKYRSFDDRAEWIADYLPGQVKPFATAE